MASDDERQEKTWSTLYRWLVKLFSQYGREGATGNADFWVVDDNYGWKRNSVYIFNLELLTPSIVTAVRGFLIDFPDWTIALVVCVDGKENEWPEMGVTVRRHEIIDGLQREYLPSPYNQLEFPGSRPGTGYD